ncbi:MAG: hypothetical protein AAFS10_07105 [Myxococcota bacterium]
MSTMTTDPLGTLRHLLHDEPQPSSWRALQQLLDTLSDDLLPVALTYAEAHLAHWPDVERDITGIAHPRPNSWPLGRFFDLSQSQLNDPEALLNLLDSDDVAHFTHLDLSQNRLSASEFSAILQRPWRDLRQVIASSNPFGPELGSALTETTGLVHLRALALDRVRLTNDGLRGLAHNPHLSNLHSLDLSDNRLSDAGVIALAQSGRFPGLKRLALKFNPITALALEALARSGTLGQLEVLLLRACHLDDDALITFARSPHLQNLQMLDLGYNTDITTKGLHALAQSHHRLRLQRIHLDHCNLDGDARTLIAEQFNRVHVVL